MKIEADIVRQLLLWVESFPPGAKRWAQAAPIAGFDHDVLNFHAVELVNGGLLSGKLHSNFRRETVADVLLLGLTPKGRDLLDKIRDDRNWVKVLKFLGEKGSSIALATLSAVASAVATTYLGP